MAKFCPLFSGSSGNCTYIAAEGTGVLIDAGVSAKRIEQALCDRSVDPRSIQAVVVTHEHVDHIAGVRVLCKRYGYRLIASAGTLMGMGNEATPNAEVMPQSGIAVGDLWLTAFPTPHDTPESTGYIVCLPSGQRVGVATDMGHITDRVTEELSRCDTVLIESNHDVQMLRNGAYPWALKQRILGERGHLSNDACAAVLPTLVERGVKYLYLGHLSAENNRPSLAEQGACRALSTAGVCVGVDCRVQVASRDANLPVQWI